MADASRFPQLALPFAVVGAAAGWLSAGITDNPLVGYEVSRPVAALCATAFGALTGVILKPLCVGKRLWYEMGERDPESRPWTDAWPLQTGIVVAAGALTGALVAVLCHEPSPQEFALGGALCAVAFLPVCFAVIAAGRRAQRARLGSMVAGGDRRAVWGILAMLLAAMTLEAVPDWPAWRAGEGVLPWVVPAAIAAALAVTLRILVTDRRALAHAQAEIEAMPSDQGPDEDPGDDRLPRLDLGIGDELRARVGGGAAYRGRQRTLALVKGTPGLSLGALQRAVLRGKVGLALIGVLVAGHAAAMTNPALAAYQAQRCDQHHLAACDPPAQKR
jgi:hypothetical protein